MHSSKVFKNILNASVALTLIMASAHVSLSEAHATPQALLAIPNKDRSVVMMSDEQFLRLLRSQLIRESSDAAGVADRAKSLRPHLASEIHLMLSAMGLDVGEEDPLAETSAQSSSGISTTGAVVGGGVALALAGGAAAVLMSNGDTESAANEDPKNPIFPFEPPPPIDPGPGPKGPPEAFETDEYLNSRHLVSLNASHVHAYGYTGEGINVAHIGPGVDIDHPEFQGRIVNPYNAVSGDSDVSYENKRGTRILGLLGAAKDGKGIQGLAYGANLIPISLADRSTGMEINIGATGNYLARAVDHAVANDAKVITNSYYLDAQALPALNEAMIRMALPGLMSSLDKAVEDDIVMVFPTGNDGMEVEAGLPAMLPKYVSGIQGNWLAVGSLNTIDDNRAVFSNRCGDAAAWCLFAPGNSLKTTNPGGGYARLSTETSGAAAVVAAGVALLRQMYPHMTAQEITSLLLESADKKGKFEDYGHGVMNLTRAFQPAGTLAVPMGARVDGKAVSIDRSSLRLADAFGDGVVQSLQGHTLVALDKYNRGFDLKIADLVAPIQRESRKDALHRLKLFGGVEERSINTVDAGPFSITTATRLRSSDPALGSSGYSRMEFSFAGDGYSMTAGMNPDLGRSFGLREMGFGQAPLMVSDSFDQPHLALMETGFGSSFGFDVGEKSDLQIAAFTGNIAVEDKSPFSSAPSLFGGVGEFRTGFIEGMELRAAVGAVSEEGSLLGSVSRGAFGENMRSNTMFTSLGGVFDLTDRTRLTFAGSLGHSSFKQSGGLIRGGDGIVTSSFGIGLAQDDFVQEGDVLSLAVSQPLRVEAGSIDLTVPTSRSVDGAVSYRRMSLNPQPSGREIDLQASYGFDVMTGVNASFGAMHRFDANHVKGEHETIGMMSVSFRF